MDTYKNTVMKYLAGEGSGGGDGASLLEKLYWNYAEENRMETEDMGTAFDSLDGILSQLPSGDHDAVWNLACDLCIAHQRQGFLHGIRVGARLVSELGSEE